MKKEYVLLVIIIVFAVFLRFWQLGQIPVSMSDDETKLVYSAYSIWKTSKEISGNVFPLAFVIDQYAFNPVPIYITSIFVGLIDLNMFAARLPFAMAGTISVVLLYFITINILRSKAMAFFSSFALSVSAWHLQISRFAYEGAIALFLYMTGIFIFLNIKKKNTLLTIVSMLVFLLAFYSYSGMKIIFLPLIIVLIWYKYRDLNKLQLATIVLLIAFSFGSFYYLGKTQNATQYGGYQLFFLNIEKASNAIELERRVSPAPELLKKLYHNKLTYWSKIFIEQYSYAFSPQYLFTSQEGSGIFSLWFRGQLYYVESILLFLGILYLFLKHRREFILLFLLLLIAPLPSGLGAEPITYTIRSSFMLPWLMIVVGSGIYSIYYFVGNNYVRSTMYIVLIFVYLYLIGGYLNQYYFEWTRYGSKYYSKADKDLSVLIDKEKNNKKEISVVGVSTVTFLHYAFYTKLSPTTVQGNYKNKPISIENITFHEKCEDVNIFGLETSVSKDYLYIVLPDCVSSYKKTNKFVKPTSVVTSIEGIDEWAVFGDL